MNFLPQKLKYTLLFVLFLNAIFIKEGVSSETKKLRKRSVQSQDLEIDLIFPSQIEVQPSEIKETGSMIYDQTKQQLIVLNSDSPSLNDGQILCSTASFYNQLHEIGFGTLKNYKLMFLKDGTKQKSKLIKNALYLYRCGVLVIWKDYQPINKSMTSILIYYQNVLSLLFLKIIIDGDTQEWEKIEKIYESTQPYIQDKIKNLDSLDDKDKQFWIQIGLSQLQLEGLMNGANTQNVYNQYTMAQMYLINSDGQFQELVEIMTMRKMHNNNLYLKNSKKSQMKSTLQSEASMDEKLFSDLYKTYNTQNFSQIWQQIIRSSLRCSALFKVIRNPENEKISDIVFAHSTWDSYSEMFRFFKHYEFALLEARSPIKGLNKFSVSFSSYPGIITSSDDFFMVNNSLIVTETSIDILNKDLYRSLLPFDRNLPDSMRIVAANRLSSTSEEWHEWISYINTGTYNSIWMVLDLNKAQRAVGTSDLPENTLLLIEQIPTQIESLDITDILLEQDYWSSFNIPYLKNIRKQSGYEAASRKSSELSFESNLRSKIFQEHAEDVQDLNSLKDLMLLNPKVNSDEELERHALAQRFDLYSSPFYSGMIDTKCSNIEMAKKQVCHAINGPSHINHAPFSFSDTPDIPHKGLPDTYDFDWVTMDLVSN